MSEYQERENHILAEQIKTKYEIWFEGNGILHGPTRPPHNGETPIFNQEASKETLFEADKDEVKNFMENRITAHEAQELVLKIVNKIVKQITGNAVENSAHLFIMSKDEFNYIKSKAKMEQAANGETMGEFHGIHFGGGLIILEGSKESSAIPLAFHEVGHSFYPPEGDTFKDEFRAMYFQIIATKLLDIELEKVGINAQYGNSYDTTIQPTTAHKEAWDKARTLDTYITLYDDVVKGNADAENQYTELYPLINQPHKN